MMISIFLSLAMLQNDDAPFEEGSWLNWVANGLLYFVYFFLIVMALSVTFWSLTARGFWSWLVAAFVAFFLAMWLGRYWGYGLCLGAFESLFVAIKLYLGVGQRPEQVVGWATRLKRTWEKTTKERSDRYRKD